MNIQRVVNDISAGKLVIIPTDTVYGIVGDALNEEVVHKVYEVKKRDYSKPLILMVSSVDMLRRYVSTINELEMNLIERYWPGKLTILFQKNENVSDLITSGSSLVGIRYPDNGEIIDIINKLDRPLISTSCNISSKNVITSVDMLEEEIEKYISYIYDGGVLSDTSSTIVKVNNNCVEIVREGELAPLIRKEFEGDDK